MASLLNSFRKVPILPLPEVCIRGQAEFHEEPAGIDAFVQLAYDDGWVIPGFDWANWAEGRILAANIHGIDDASMQTIRKLITALVRNDRFCEGSLQAAYKQGLIHAILRRVERMSDEV